MSMLVVPEMTYSVCVSGGTFYPTHVSLLVDKYLISVSPHLRRYEWYECAIYVSNSFPFSLLIAKCCFKPDQITNWITWKSVVLVWWQICMKFFLQCPLVVDLYKYNNMDSRVFILVNNKQATKPNWAKKVKTTYIHNTAQQEVV